MQESSQKNIPIDIAKLRYQEVLQLDKHTQIPDTLIQENITMIEGIARTIASKSTLPTGIELNDLISWGSEGLIKAYRSFDPKKGSTFQTYSYYRIRGEIYDSIRKEWNHKNPITYQKYKKNLQEKLADFIEESLESGIELNTQKVGETLQKIMAASAMSYVISLENIEEKEEPYYVENHLDPNTFLQEEIDKLSSEEQEIINLFYTNGLKQKEIASKLNLSTSKVCRLHLKILEKLKIQLEKRSKE